MVQETRYDCIPEVLCCTYRVDSYVEVGRQDIRHSREYPGLEAYILMARRAVVKIDR